MNPGHQARRVDPQHPRLRLLSGLAVHPRRPGDLALPGRHPLLPPLRPLPVRLHAADQSQAEPQGQAVVAERRGLRERTARQATNRRRRPRPRHPSPEARHDVPRAQNHPSVHLDQHRPDRPEARRRHLRPFPGADRRRHPFAVRLRHRHRRARRPAVHRRSRWTRTTPMATANTKPSSPPSSAWPWPTWASGSPGRPSTASSTPCTAKP